MGGRFSDGFVGQIKKKNLQNRADPKKGIFHPSQVSLCIKATVDFLIIRITLGKHQKRKYYRYWLAHILLSLFTKEMFLKQFLDVLLQESKIKLHIEIC